ncbi:MAG: hypothetical protein N3A38_11750 [Planctomycetota bacterium]|nr:hypothetical protein [Planctomycetota bacterium]
MRHDRAGSGPEAIRPIRLSRARRIRRARELREDLSDLVSDFEAKRDPELRMPWHKDDYLLPLRDRLFALGAIAKRMAFLRPALVARLFLLAKTTPLSEQTARILSRIEGQARRMADPMYGGGQCLDRCWGLLLMETDAAHPGVVAEFLSAAKRLAIPRLR